MSIGPVKSWAFSGTLLDALRDTRTAVTSVDLPYESPTAARARELIHDITEQLDKHLIPRVSEHAAPAVVVVSGSTGSGKSTIVNALLGEQLTAAGVLRPTTMVPHLFHHPLDLEQLSSAARRAAIHSSESVPRGLAIVDSPDIDSLVGENRVIARELLDAADLWVFVTTAARYGDAVPWTILKMGALRGASIAIVLNRVTADVAAQIRRDLVERLRREGLDSLPLFVIPEEPGGLDELPRDVVQGLRRWLDAVAESSATTIVERTLQGATEALKEWLEELAELMDDQAEAVKVARGAVRRAAASAEQEGGDAWYTDVTTGPVATMWAQATVEGGPLFKVRTNAWAKRRTARDARDATFFAIGAELTLAVEQALAFTAAQASERMVAALGPDEDGPGAWLVGLRDAAEARVARERHAREAALAWLQWCEEAALGLPNVQPAIDIVGQQGVAATFASAALGVSAARQVLTLLVGPGMHERFDRARVELAAARRYCINREALDMIRPTDKQSLVPDASAAIRLRRAELRSLL